MAYNYVQSDEEQEPYGRIRVMRVDGDTVTIYKLPYKPGKQKPASYRNKKEDYLVKIALERGGSVTDIRKP